MLADALERRAEPDVSLIWFNDPDMTYHYKGIGSEEARQALRAVDDGFGTLLDTIAAREDAERFQVVAMSDHGQIVARNLIDVKGAFTQAGIRYGKGFGEDVEVVGNVSSTSALRVRDTGALYRVAEFLVDQTWVGAVFTAGLGGPTGIVPGTLNKDLLNISHSRAPDIYCVMASDEATTHGVAGGGPYRSDVPEGGGMHGGLNRHELNNVLFFGGSRAKKRFASNVPGGIIDVAPTILALFGKRPAPSMLGRVWTEALADGGDEPEVVDSVAETSRNGRLVRLTRHTVGRGSSIGGLETR
jgi:arylsulfatase A-like enzyme